MTTTDVRRAVGTFKDRMQAERALTRLREAGFDMKDVSIVSKHEQQGEIAGVDVQQKVGTKADEGAATGAVAGGTLGGLTGLLVGLGALAIPGIGPVMTAGALGTALASALAGGAIGATAGGITGALIGMGIPEDRAETYDRAIRSGNYLVMVDGTPDEIRQAENVLQESGIQNYGMFSAPSGTYREEDYRDRGTLGERGGAFAQRTEGQVQETWGKATGDPSDQAMGRAKQRDADTRDRS
ncbi:CsbD family protein [Anthocerotibacter panamensis]|uniref:CsbD family protein n=1 Tax=Anthocerotibacter panamensis TaxID=2857077 RepID=UPI001C4056C6|nr:CsbD family protein [Anthocerotibacter panamensis]